MTENVPKSGPGIATFLQPGAFVPFEKNISNYDKKSLTFNNCRCSISATGNTFRRAMTMRANKKPISKFKLLLIILAGIMVLIAVLFVAAFGMLQMAQEYGLIEVPGGTITLENLSEIDQGTMEMVSYEYQPMSAIESITMEYFMEDN